MKEYVTLQLREADWTFRALDLDQIEELEPQFALVDTLQSKMSKEGANAVAVIACASLQAKHAGTSVEQVRKLITLATITDVISAVRGISGLEPVPGEAAAGS